MHVPPKVWEHGRIYDVSISPSAFGTSKVSLQIAHRSKVMFTWGFAIGASTVGVAGLAKKANNMVISRSNIGYKLRSLTVPPCRNPFHHGGYWPVFVAWASAWAVRCESAVTTHASIRRAHMSSG